MNDLRISLTASGDMALVIPGEPSHTISIPITLTGLVYLRTLLALRERTPDAKIGTPAAPTQEMVRAFLSTHKVEQIKPISVKSPLLESLDLELSL